MRQSCPDMDVFSSGLFRRRLTCHDVSDMHAIFVHGWEGWPENAWFPWLRKELEARGYTTEALKLPNPAVPDRALWVRMVGKAIRGPDTVLIGHSLGCPTILFALRAYDGPPLAGVVLVSGFARDYHIPGLANWFRGDHLDVMSLRPKAKKWSVVHAKIDPLVPFAEGTWLAKQLDVPIIIPKQNGHLSHMERSFEVPEILSAVLDQHP